MTELADVLDLGSSAEKRAGSNPVLGTNAGIAQLEEQRLCKSKVVGSSPATGSKNVRTEIVMVAIANLDTYTSGMRKSMEDKLWFLDFMSEDITSVYDYGCADGTLLGIIKQEKPNVHLFGYDNNMEMLSMAKLRVPGCVLTRERMESAEPGQLTIASSVFHEIHSYGSPESIRVDYQHIFGIGSRYIAIRDMFYSTKMPIIAPEEVVRAVRGRANQSMLREFESIYGSIEQSKNLMHWFLKYRYIENWCRECRENYLPNSFENFLHLIPQSYELVYAEMYTLPFLRNKIYKDYAIDWSYPTHGKIYLKKRG